MKISKTMVWVGMAVALGCVLAGVRLFQQQAAREAADSQAKATLPTQPDRAESQPRNAAPPAVTPAPPELLARGETTTQPPPATPAPPSLVKPPPAATVPNPVPVGAPYKDPLARDALCLVGVDPVAEAYWIGAINDPSLPAEERQNLIEDLNEDGLSDTKLPTLDDLPLIAKRLLLIEDLAPYAVDDVNFAAFQEAYKDLLNLAEVAMGGGEPVN